MMSFPRIVLVTGGNNGIGYETVKALLQSDKPYHVLLGSRSKEKGQSAVERLKKECVGVSSTVETVQVDLNSDKSIEDAFETVKASHGRIDALINNAGKHNDSLGVL
jgi:NAD(P)-dependent dehydrogenase (short-subunit alcohol dehydrogenase family)